MLQQVKITFTVFNEYTQYFINNCTGIISSFVHDVAVVQLQIYSQIKQTVLPWSDPLVANKLTTLSSPDLKTEVTIMDHKTQLDMLSEYVKCLC